MKEFSAKLGKKIAAELEAIATANGAKAVAMIQLEAEPWHRRLELNIMLQGENRREPDTWVWWQRGGDRRRAGAQPRVCADRAWPDIAEVDALYDEYERIEEKDDETALDNLKNFFFDQCAVALCGKTVKKSLAGWKLAKDFVFEVKDPDSASEFNYCAAHTWVNQELSQARLEVCDRTDISKCEKSAERVGKILLMYEDLNKEHLRILSKFINTTELTLAQIGTDKLPAFVGRYQTLKVLQLFPTFRNIDALVGMTTLETLQLATNEYFDSGMAKVIGKLKSLKELSLSGCNLKSVPVELKSLRSLEKLWLGNNPEITHVPDWLFKLKNLKFVYLPQVLAKEISRLKKQYPGLDLQPAKKKQTKGKKTNKKKKKKKTVKKQTAKKSGKKPGKNPQQWRGPF